MNRQKKELLKQIEQIRIEIAVDEELGCGFAPPHAYDRMYEDIYQLQEKLAHLSHYGSVEEMLYDERGKPSEEEILRQAESKQSRRRSEVRAGGKKTRKRSRGECR